MKKIKKHGVVKFFTCQVTRTWKCFEGNKAKDFFVSPKKGTWDFFRLCQGPGWGVLPFVSLPVRLCRRTGWKFRFAEPFSWQTLLQKPTSRTTTRVREARHAPLAFLGATLSSTKRETTDGGRKLAEGKEVYQGNLGTHVGMAVFKWFRGISMRALKKCRTPPGITGRIDEGNVVLDLGPTTGTMEDDFRKHEPAIQWMCHFTTFGSKEASLQENVFKHIVCFETLPNPDTIDFPGKVRFVIVGWITKLIYSHGFTKKKAILKGWIGLFAEGSFAA